MEKREVRDGIIKLISDKFGIEREKLYNDGEDKSLLDASIGLQPRDLLTLFFELQKKYGVVFKEEDITERRFDRLDSMVGAIIDRL